MHKSSMTNMKEFKDNFFAKDFSGSVLDVGSMDVNGTYRPLFDSWEYVGLDILEGKGVDITSFDDLPDNYFDCIISGQTLEHTEDDVSLVKGIDVVLKPGGLCCLIAPSQGKLHHLPDYRRYTEEMMIELAEGVGWYVLATKISPETPWHDCVLVAKKL